MTKACRNLVVVCILGALLVSTSTAGGCSRRQLGGGPAAVAEGPSRVAPASAPGGRTPAEKPLTAGAGTVAIMPQGGFTLPAGASTIVPSPRGDLLVFYLQPGGAAFLAGRDGVTRRQLPGYDHYGPASWSQDGAWLTYYTSSGAPSSSARRCVVVFSVADGSWREVSLDDVPCDPIEPVPVLAGAEPNLILCTATGRYSTAMTTLTLARIRGEFDITHRTGPRCVSSSGRVACADAGGVVEFLPAEDFFTGRVRVPGEIAGLSFDPSGKRIAIVSRLPSGYRLHVAPTSEPGEPVLVAEGEGTASGVCWSLDGRFLAFRVSSPAGIVGRFIDTATWSAADHPAVGLAGLAWLDPYTAVALSPVSGGMRADLLSIGDPPRVTDIEATERRGGGDGPSEERSLRVANGARVVLAGSRFEITARYDRGMAWGAACPAVTCAPGPPPAVAGWGYDRGSIVTIRFNDGIPMWEEVQVGVAPLHGGESVKLVLSRVPEPEVTIRSLDRPECKAMRRTFLESFSYVLGLGTKRFRIEFSRPMDRGSVEDAVRQGLDAANRVTLDWDGAMALNVAVTCHNGTSRLSIDLEGAKSLEGATVFGQPSFYYSASGPYHLVRMRPDGTDATEVGILEGSLESRFARLPPLSPDGAWLAYSECVGSGSERGIYLHWGRPVAGDELVKLPAAPVGWFPDSRRLLCGLNVVDARTGQVLQTLPGAPAEYSWRAALSPSGRRGAVLRPIDRERHRLGLTVYDLESGSAQDLGDVGGYYVSDGFLQFAAPAWSPDERAIAFVDTDGAGMSRLTIVDLTTGRRTVPWGEALECWAYTPCWSPNGRWILARGAAGLRVITPDGQVVHAFGADGDLIWPCWSPDGSRLLYTGRQGWAGVYVLDVASGETRAIFGEVGLGWSPDGSHIFVTRV